MNYKRFYELDVYRKNRQFRNEVYLISQNHFPECEKFLLKDQILRSSRSVTANLAEGIGRHYFQDNIRFCRLARGSLEETLEHLIVAYDRQYISEALLKGLKIKQDRCLLLINGYIRHLKTKKDRP